MKARATYRLAAAPKNLAALRDFVEQTATVWRADPDAIPNVVLAVDELATNIMVHGYAGQPGEIEVELRLEGHDLVIHLRDQARQFDPTRVPPPDMTLPLEQRPIGGVGLHIVRQVMDEIRYRPLGGGNELTLIKRGLIAGNSTGARA
jgi:serine/threonine-protein kinase RsbW